MKPKAAKVATNLTVLTSRRRYQIDYTALAQRPAADDPDVIFALRFTYPPAAAQSLLAAEAKRIDSALGEASAGTTAKHRLLVLRQPGAAPGRRLGRRRPYAAALCRECGFARHFRAQCRRQRVLAQLQHGRGRRHRASGGAPIHSAPRQADRMHRQPGIQRRRAALGFGNGDARGRAPGTRSRSMSAEEPDAGSSAGRARHHGRQSCPVDPVAAQQRACHHAHEHPRLGFPHVVLRACDLAARSRAAKRSERLVQPCPGRYGAARAWGGSIHRSIHRPAGGCDAIDSERAAGDTARAPPRRSPVLRRAARRAVPTACRRPRRRRS